MDRNDSDLDLVQVPLPACFLDPAVQSAEMASPEPGDCEVSSQSSQTFGMSRTVVQKMVWKSIFLCFRGVPAMHRTRQEVI